MKQIIKRSLALLLCAVMILGFVPFGASAADTEITLWSYPIGNWGSEEATYNLLREFEEANPGITVKFERLDYMDGDTKVNSITRQQRQKLCETVKAFEIKPKALRPIEEAVVTRGGVKINEISPKTMESKLVKGLYFAGELIDIDAVTGGFNLQIAFSTGYLAGVSIADAINTRWE